jgi:hypothetical protein
MQSGQGYDPTATVATTLSGPASMTVTLSEVWFEQ